VVHKCECFESDKNSQKETFRVKWTVVPQVGFDTATAYRPRPNCNVSYVSIKIVANSLNTLKLVVALRPMERTTASYFVLFMSDSRFKSV